MVLSIFDRSPTPSAQTVQSPLGKLPGSSSSSPRAAALPLPQTPPSPLIMTGPKAIVDGVFLLEPTHEEKENEQENRSLISPIAFEEDERMEEGSEDSSFDSHFEAIGKASSSSLSDTSAFPLDSDEDDQSSVLPKITILPSTTLRRAWRTNESLPNGPLDEDSPVSKEPTLYAGEGELPSASHISLITPPLSGVVGSHFAANVPRRIRPDYRTHFAMEKRQRQQQEDFGYSLLFKTSLAIKDLDRTSSSSAATKAASLTQVVSTVAAVPDWSSYGVMQSGERRKTCRARPIRKSGGGRVRAWIQ